MKKVLCALFAFMMMLSVLTSCATNTAKESGTLTIAWYPNESGEDLKAARDALGEAIEQATGKKVIHQLTTDYVIAIESLANGNADLAFMGAVGYIEANIKNSKVQPLVVPSGKSGTLEDAVYYSWLIVRKGNEDQYRSGDDFTIDNIAGKRFAFVSSSSTSGFRVPSAGIVAHFSQKEQYKDLKQDDLLEGGRNNFFSEVLYGGSHQGAAVNLLLDRADIASVCDTCIANYIELVSGTENRPGAVYKVSADAAEPFNTLVGEEFVLISVTPVLNAPFAINTQKVSEADVKAIRDAFTSDAMAANESIFIPADSANKGLFRKTGNERFIAVDDSFFNPIRDLSK